MEFCCLGFQSWIRKSGNNYIYIHFIKKINNYMYMNTSACIPERKSFKKFVKKKKMTQTSLEQFLTRVLFSVIQMFSVFRNWLGTDSWPKKTPPHQGGGLSVCLYTDFVQRWFCFTAKKIICSINAELTCIYMQVFFKLVYSLCPLVYLNS